MSGAGSGLATSADKAYSSKPISGHMRLCGISDRSKQRNTVERAVSRLRRRRRVLP